MSKNFTTEDEIFMKRALLLAKTAEGKTSPNPMVGAVFVVKGKIIAEGFHKQAGSEHAEVHALKNLSSKHLKSGILYISLEPCSHFGRTAPCADFLIQKGVRKVFVAMKDPNPLVSGKGIQKLRKAGIQVEVGLLKKEAEKLNEVFIYSITQKLPFVILKCAFTLDGKIATKNGDSQWISNELSRTHVHLLRSKVDAILTSSSTVIADDPHLGVRMVKGKDPLRIILDSKLKTVPSAKVYQNKNVIVVTNVAYSLEKSKEFKKHSIELVHFEGTTIDLKKLLSILYQKGITSLMIEAGSQLATSFLRDKLVQKVYFFIAPKIFGEGLNVFGDLGIGRISEALILQNIVLERFGDDIMIEGSIS